MDRFTLPCLDFETLQLTQSQARRVQFRLQSAQECSHMVGVLEQRGMEFQQQRPHTGRPSSARPETSGAEARPLTTQTYSAKGTFGVPPKPNPFRLQTLEAGGLSSQTPSDARRTWSASQTTPRQASMTGAVDDVQQRIYQSPVGADHTMLAPGQKGPDSTTSRGVLLEGPAYDHDSGMGHQTMTSPVRHISPSIAYDRPALYETADAPSMLSSPEVERPTMSQSTLLNVPISPSSRDTTATARISTGGDLALSGRSNSLYQPSAPTSLRLPDTLEHEMPPRRELPFKRPGSRQSSSSRPSTSTKSVSYTTAAADSSEPTAASSILSPARNLTTNRPATASPLKRAVAPSQLEPTKKALAVEMRPQTQASHLPSASSPPRPTYTTTMDGSFRRPNDLGELLRINNPLAERSPNSNKIARVDSTADAQYELETPPGTSSSRTKTNTHAVSSSPSRIDGRVSTSPSKADSQAMPSSTTKLTDPVARASSVVQGPVDSVETTALASYASQSREDRQTVLDEFMVSKLEDPNFAVLCEDLDSCWRRIALGL